MFIKASYYDMSCVLKITIIKNNIYKAVYIRYTNNIGSK